MPQNPYDEEALLRRLGAQPYGQSQQQPRPSPARQRSSVYDRFIPPEDPDEALLRQLGAVPYAPPEPSSYFDRFVSDPLVSVTRGLHDVPTAALGLADIVTGGRAGKLVEDYTPWNPQETDAYLQSLYTPEQRQAFENVQKAEGFLGTGEALLENLSVVPHAILQTLPGMYGGGAAGSAVARGAAKFAPAIAARVAGAAGAIGEGVYGAGSAAEQMRQQDPSRTLGGRGTLAALASGVGTTAFGLVGQRVGKAFGTSDVDQWAAEKFGKATLKEVAEDALEKGTQQQISLARQIVGGFVQEGFFEELPQSIHEQVMSNWAAGKDLMDGVSEAAVLGAVVGGVMGAGHNVISGLVNPPPPPKDTDEDDDGITYPPPAPDEPPDVEPGPPPPPAPEEPPEDPNLPTSAFLEELYQKEEAEREAERQRRFTEAIEKDKAAIAAEKERLSKFPLMGGGPGAVWKFYQALEDKLEAQRQQAQDEAEERRFLAELQELQATEEYQQAEDEHAQELREQVATGAAEEQELTAFLEEQYQKREAGKEQKLEKDFMERLAQQEEGQRRMGDDDEMGPSSPPSGVPPIKPTLPPPLRSAADDIIDVTDTTGTSDIPIDRATPIDLHRDIVERLVTAAKTIDPKVNPEVIERTLDERVRHAHRLVASAAVGTEEQKQSGKDPVDLAQAIASLGGMNEQDIAPGNRYWKRKTGEIRTLKEEAAGAGGAYGGRFGSMFGVPGVFRNTGGLPPDMLVQSLHQFPRFRWIEGPNDLQEFLTLSARQFQSQGKGERGITLGDLRIDPSTQWWVPSHLRAISRITRMQAQDRDLETDATDFMLDTPTGPPGVSRFDEERGQFRERRDDLADRRGAEDYPASVREVLEDFQWDQLAQLQEADPDTLDDDERELFEQLSGLVQEAVTEADMAEPTDEDAEEWQRGREGPDRSGVTIKPTSKHAGKDPQEHLDYMLDQQRERDAEMEALDDQKREASGKKRDRLIAEFNAIAQVIRDGWQEIADTFDGIDIDALRREVEQAPKKGQPDYVRRPARVARADEREGRRRRNYGGGGEGYFALEDALSPEAQHVLDEIYKEPTNGRWLRVIRNLMEEYEKLLNGGDAKKWTEGPRRGNVIKEEELQQVADTVRQRTEHFLIEWRDVGPDKAPWALLHNAEKNARAWLYGELDPDLANLEDTNVLADAQEVARLVWDTLDPKTATFDATEFNTAEGIVEFRKPAADLFPPPAKGERVIMLATTDGPALKTKEEGQKQIQAWKNYIKNLSPAEKKKNGKKAVISLFDRTGTMSQPYKDAGYHVERFDIENGNDLMDFVSWMERIEELIRDKDLDIVAVLGQPPCTSYSVATNGRWEQFHEANEKAMVRRSYGQWAAQMFDTPIDYANTLTAVFKLIVQQSNPTIYAMENPLGSRIKKQTQLPENLLSFDPNAFGDDYVKRTAIWGDFDPHLPFNRVPGLKEDGGQGSKIWNMSGEDQLERSETPEGFAYAFFMANHGEALEKAKDDAGYDEDEDSEREEDEDSEREEDEERDDDDLEKKIREREQQHETNKKPWAALDPKKKEELSQLQAVSERYNNSVKGETAEESELRSRQWTEAWDKYEALYDDLYRQGYDLDNGKIEKRAKEIYKAWREEQKKAAKKPAVKGKPPVTKAAKPETPVVTGAPPVTVKRDVPPPPLPVSDKPLSEMTDKEFLDYSRTLSGAQMQSPAIMAENKRRGDASDAAAKAAKAAKAALGKGPPTTTKNDQGQPALPGAEEVRKQEIATPEIELPPQALTLKAEEEPKTTPSLFDKQDAAHQDVKNAFKDIFKAIGGGGLKMGFDPTLEGKLPILVYRAVKALAKAGIVDAKIAWAQVESAFGAAAGDLVNAFKVAWRQVHGVTPDIVSTHPPSKTAEEKNARVKAAAEDFDRRERESQPKAKPEAAPPVAAPKVAAPAPAKPAGPPRTVSPAPSPASPKVEAKPPVAPPAPKPAPPKEEGPTHVTDEQTDILEDYGLVVAGYADRKGDPTVVIKGRTEDDIDERKDLFSAVDGRFHTKPFRQWHVPLRRLADFIRGLGALPKTTGKAKRRIPAHLRDASLAQLRTNAAGRPDRSGFDRDIREFVSDRTQGVIQKGKAIGIAQNTLDEQKEDIAILVRNKDRGLKAGILASDPGTGKTFVLGGTIRELVHRGADTVVYVTKSNDLIAQAKADMQAFGIVDKVQFLTYAKFRETPPVATDVLIFDEAHEIKNVRANSASEQGRQGQAWIQQAGYTIIATATPYENPTQVAYLAPTGIFDEVFGEFGKFAAAFGATPILINKELGLYDYQWKRTASSNQDQKEAREWMRKEGFFTSRKMRLPKEQVDTRLVKVKGDDAIARTFAAIMAARAKYPPPGNGAMWITNFAKRLLEASKVGVAIKEAQAALDRDRYPIIFVETKAETIINIPKLVEKEKQWALAAAQAKRTGDSPPLRKGFGDKDGLPPMGVVDILAAVMADTGEADIHIPSAEDVIQDAFGEDNVAIYTGSVSPKKAQENLAAWRKQDQPRVLVATMAKGGTGLSLHDKVGDHQTTQINLNLPWNATGVVQVTQRSARYGMQGKAEIMWLFADNVAMDKWLSKRVGARMQDMGAIVHGEVLQGSKEIEDWNFDDPILSEDEGEVDSYAGYEGEASSLGSFTQVADEEQGDDDDTEEQTDIEDEENIEEEEENEGGIEQKTYYDKPPRGPGTHPETGSEVYGFEMTELVELAKELLGLPKIVKRFRKLGQLGVFKYGKGKAGISIHAELFKEGRERELAQVLAHEIGHLIDWLGGIPEKDLRRGNLLGRLFTLHKFMQSTFVTKDGNIIEEGDIRDELMRVSDLWRPYNRATAPDSFKKYRDSGVELMADAMSALLTDPEMLERNAPTFYAEFLKAMDQKPEVKREYYALQHVMTLTPEERAERRVERDRARVKAGGEKAVQIEKDKVKKIADARWRDWQVRLKQQLLDINAPVIKRVKALAKQGKALAEHLDPRYLLQERNYVGGKIRGWMSRNVRPLVEQLDKAGVSWDDFGLFLEYDRSIKGDYMEKAAGMGRGPGSAKQDRDALAKDYTPEQMEIIEESIAKFRIAVAEVVEDAYKAGLYKPKLYDQFKKNKAYATFRGIEYLHKDITARVHHAKGSFQDVANVGTATILKMIVTMRETQNQKVKRSVFDMLTEHFPTDIELARRTGPLANDFAGAENRDLKEVGYFDNGVWQRMYVDPLIAISLNNESIGRNLVVMQAINYINSKVFRPLFVGYNPGFMMFNVVRDFLRTWKNFNDQGHQLSLAGAIKRYRQAGTLARVRAFGPKDVDTMTAAEKKAWSQLTAAEEHFIFNLPFKREADREVQETELKDIMARTGTIEEQGPPKTGWRKAVAPVASFFNWMEKVGNFIETLPKAAAMLEMIGDEKQVKDLTPSQTSFLREKVGTPDIHAGGTLKPITNELFLFSNVILQGWRADMNVARGDIEGRLPGGDPKTRSGWAWKTAMLNVLPKMLMMAATMGLMGEWLRKLFERVPEYDKSNYLIVPLGIDEKGNAMYMRLPQDDTGRTIGGLAWKAMRQDKNIGTVLANTVDYSFGQIPGLTPSLKGGLDLGLMMAGQNPYDYFRGRNLFTDEEMKAGGPENWAKFVRSQIQSVFGGYTGTLLKEKRPSERTGRQDFLDAPIVSNIAGRVFKVTDAGLNETLREVKAEVAGARARLSRDERGEVSDAIRQLQGRPPWEQQMGGRMALARKIVERTYPDMPRSEQSKKTMEVQKKIAAGLVRGSADPWVEEVMSAGSNAEKRAVVERARKSMSAQEFTGWLDRAASNAILSRELAVAIKQNRPATH